MNTSRHFVHINGRRVHYRRWGHGPVVLAVHGSPQSSRALANQAAAFCARGLSVIAPDTPGNGASEALAEGSSTEAYARALVAFADAIGLGRVGVYGFHTGAATACAFAALQPGRVTAIAFDGLPAWTEAERADILANYLTPFTPTWDGAHMAWLWARLEEQTVFFPWHSPTPGARMDYDVPPIEALHANAIDFLDAGDAYRTPYASAFTFRPRDWLARVGAPALLGVTAGDPLSVHIARAELAGLSSEIHADQPSLLAAAAAHLAAYPGDAAPAASAAGSDREGLTRGFVEADGRRLFWRGRLEGAGRPLVLLHDAGGSADVWAPALVSIAAARPVVAFDLPGHGASGDDWPDAPETVAGFAEAIHQAGAALGLDRYSAAGLHLGGQIAAELTLRGAAQNAASLGVVRYAAAEAAQLSLRGAPSLAPEWDGAHLVRAFRIARWERLFDPWFLRDRAHAVPQGDLAPTAVHARAVSLLKAGGRWASALRAQAAYTLKPVESLRVFALEEGPPCDAAQLAGFGEPITRLPAEVGLWGRHLALLGAP